MDTSIPQKRCFRCKQLKPATLDYFGSQKEKRDHLTPHCKECENARRRAKYVKKTEALPDGYKRCARCKEVYPLTIEYFSPLKSSRSGLRPTCRKCRAKEWKIYNDAHAENHKQYYRAHREKITKNSNNHYWTHREQVNKLAKQRRDLYPERARQHQQAHAEQYRTYNNNRRARKKAVPGTYTPAQIQEQLKRQHYKCYYAACGYAKFKKVKGKYIYHVEHTFPVTREDARNEISHIVLACPSCNSKKGNKYPWEWPEGGRLL